MATSETLVQYAISSRAENLQCCDCELVSVTHISVQNGVTLCEACAQLHK